MQQSATNAHRPDGVVFVLVVTIFLLAPPLVKWWATAESPWYLPYLIWASILAASVVFRRIGRHEI